MTLFWAAAALLLALALWIVAGALWRNPSAPRAAQSRSQSNLALLKAQLQQLDQDLAAGTLDAAQHRLARAEIERRALEEENVASAPETTGSPRATLALLLLAVPVLALGLYSRIGNLQALDAGTVSAQGDPTPQQMEELLQRLAERMEKQPPGQVADAEGWIMLGRTYAALQRFAEAERAYARALQLTPNDAQLLADQADVLGMRQGRNLEGEPLRLIALALQHDPRNLKALALAGSAAFERKDYTTALKFWGAAQAAAPPGSEFAQGLQRGMDEARAAGGIGAVGAAAGPGATTGQTAGSADNGAAASKGGAAAATAATSATAATAATAASDAPVSAAKAGAAAPPAAPGAASISGRISLSPELAARAAPGDTLFVFARAAEGPRMPLAIVKRTAAELPFNFTLDDSMAMAPQLKLSSFANVVVGARISKSGNATPQSGDLEGSSAALNGRSKGIEVRIDTVRP